jgi:hypothetical protein
MRFAAPLAAALVVLALATPASARTWSQKWPVGAHPVVHVTTNDARVRIHRGVPGQVEALVEYTVQFWGVHSRVRDPEITLTRVGDVITIAARTRTNLVVFGGVNERFHVDVTLPPDCDVQVRSGDGSVECDAVHGNVDLQAGDGHVTAHGVRGSTRLATGDGGIDADGLDGNLDAHSGDGHLHVAGRFDRLNLRAGDGRVDATVLRGSALAEPWSLASGDGGITLRIPRNLQALLDASAQDGIVHVELPVDTGPRRSHHELRGELNGGHVPLRVHSGDGSITLTLSE